VAYVDFSLYGIEQLMVLMGAGVLDGQACSWNKSLLIGESCNLQILETRQLSGGKTTQVFLYCLACVRHADDHCIYL
jgi:hypothetical protein